MTGILIDTVGAPQRIKDQLRILSKDIIFTREVSKGANG